MRISPDSRKTDMGQEGDAMPLGIQQNNNFAQIIVDIWNDKVFYQEQEFPAGFMAASILNISEDDLKELIQAGGAPTFLFPVVIQGSDVEAARVLPVLRERMIYLTKEIWKYPPFCYSNPEKELRRIDDESISCLMTMPFPKYAHRTQSFNRNF